MADIFTRARLSEIYFKRGILYGNKHLFAHAPLDKVEIEGVTYLTTRGVANISGAGSPTPAATGDDDGRGDEVVLDHQIFYAELNPITMEQHQMGDWQGRPDDWVGMHKLGYV